MIFNNRRITLSFFDKWIRTTNLLNGKIDKSLINMLIFIFTVGLILPNNFYKKTNLFFVFSVENLTLLVLPFYLLMRINLLAIFPC